MVIFDSTTLLVIIQPEIIVSDGSGGSLSYARERVDHLISELKKDKIKIIIPTPVIAEAFVRVDESSREKYYSAIKKSDTFVIMPFCEAAAFEVAKISTEAKKNGSKREGSEDVWAKIKYDRQIVAIGLVAKAKTIYTEDKNLSSIAQKKGINPISIATQPLPDLHYYWASENEPAL